MDNNFIDELQRVILDVRYENKMLERFEEISLQDLSDEEVEYLNEEDTSSEKDLALDKYGNIIGASPILHPWPGMLDSTARVKKI